jgi:hypothetical protein
MRKEPEEMRAPDTAAIHAGPPTRPSIPIAPRGDVQDARPVERASDRDPARARDEAGGPVNGEGGAASAATVRALVRNLALLDMLRYPTRRAWVLAQRIRDRARRGML